MSSDRLHAYRWWGLAAISLGVALIIMDSTIVSVIIPPIIKDLDLSTTQVQWVQEIYTLVFAALLMVWGRVADKVGRKRILITGVIIFVMASLACAAADSGTFLVAARAVQGIGGSMIMPTTLSLLNATFHGKERTIAFAVWGSTIGGMAAIGPVVGGWLATVASWHWAFLINLPFGLLIILGVSLFIAESKEASTQRLTDWFGGLLSIAGFGSLVFALIEGRTYGWWRAEPGASANFGNFSIIPIVFAAAVAILISFVLWERRRMRAGLSTILDVSLFGISSFANGNVTALVVSMGEFGLILSLPLWFQNVAGLDTFHAGLALVPLAVGSFVASGAVQGLAKIMTPIQMVRMGLVLEILGIAALATLIRVDSSLWMTSTTLFIYGMGVGFATAQLTSIILVDVPVERSGQGSSTQSTSRQVGSALGIAILGTALFTSLKSGTQSRVADLVAANPELQKLVDAVTHSSGGLIPQFAADERTAPIAQAASEALTHGVQIAGWIGASVLVFGLLTSMRIGKSPVSSEATKATGSPSH